MTPRMAASMEPFRYSARLASLKPSGIRKFFALGKSMKDPVDLSIGQPEFEVLPVVRDAAIQSIRDGHNRYTVTQGIDPLREGLLAKYGPRWERFGGEEMDVMVTSGVSGALTVSFLATLDPGDEILIPDPYFVMYRQLATLVGANAVCYDTYPDLHLDVERIRPLITDKTRAILVNSPCNPTGRVLQEEQARALASLVDEHGLLLISDEIYEDFIFEGRHVSPREFTPNCLVLGGASKNMGIPGWRIGWMFGPASFIDRCQAIQQFSYTCAPSMAQWGVVEGLDQDFTPYRESYRRKRDLMHEGISDLYPTLETEGAFYMFPSLPDHLDIGTFMEACIAKELLVVPGTAFSERDRNFRISFAAHDSTLERAIEILRSVAAT
jgi:aspartate/methionine/tyrosine aminotransferase